MKYKTIIVFQDEKKVTITSKRKIEEMEAIGDARKLMRNARQNFKQPIKSITNKKRFLFFYI